MRVPCRTHLCCSSFSMCFILQLWSWSILKLQSISVYPEKSHLWGQVSNSGHCWHVFSTAFATEACCMWCSLDVSGFSDICWAEETRISARFAGEQINLVLYTTFLNLQVSNVSTNQSLPHFTLEGPDSGSYSTRVLSMQRVNAWMWMLSWSAQSDLRTTSSAILSKRRASGQPARRRNKNAEAYLWVQRGLSFRFVGSFRPWYSWNLSSSCKYPRKCATDRQQMHSPHNFRLNSDLYRQRWQSVDPFDLICGDVHHAFILSHEEVTKSSNWVWSSLSVPLFWVAISYTFRLYVLDSHVWSALPSAALVEITTE